jgi:hypothetical protein
VPAEGLLGAARLAHSLRSGPPSLRSGVQRRCATLSNPHLFLSGVRILADEQGAPSDVIRLHVGICRLRDSNKGHNQLFRKRL